MSTKKNDLGVAARAAALSAVSPAKAPEDAAAIANAEEYVKASVRGYSVEVRANGNVPLTWGKNILYPTWSKATFNERKDGLGVPGSPEKAYARQIVDFHGYLGYQAAQALRWWMHAELGTSISTRLRVHKIRYEHGVDNEGTIEEVGGHPTKDVPVKDPEVYTYQKEISVALEETGWTKATGK